MTQMEKQNEVKVKVEAEEHPQITQTTQITDWSGIENEGPSRSVRSDKTG